MLPSGWLCHASRLLASIYRMTFGSLENQVATSAVVSCCAFHSEARSTWQSITLRWRGQRGRCALTGPRHSSCVRSRHFRPQPTMCADTASVELSKCISPLQALQLALQSPSKLHMRAGFMLPALQQPAVNWTRPWLQCTKQPAHVFIVPALMQWYRPSTLQKPYIQKKGLAIGTRTHCAARSLRCP